MYGGTAGEPGVRIIGDDSLYYLSDGTSMAAPMVAGAAARLLSARPDLSRQQLEDLLTMGAKDLIDPYGAGDNLVGRDSISGAGILDVASSLNLVTDGGLYFVSPDKQQRLTSPIDVRIAAVGGYSGYWQLDYAEGYDGSNWTNLAWGTQLPIGSVAALLDLPNLNGPVRLRLTDSFGVQQQIAVLISRENLTQLHSPTDGQDLEYAIPIRGSCYGPEYDSMSVSVRREGSSLVELLKSSGEFFDSLMVNWSVSGADTGAYSVYLTGWFQSGTQIDSARFHVASSFASGWPQHQPGRCGITPACADIDGDGDNELVVPTQSGLFVYHHDGTIVAGYPVLPMENMQSIPAIYDVDRDGKNDIIICNETGIHVFRYDGSYADGWPQECLTGRISFGYGYPIPTVTRLAMDADSAIVIINKFGDILAYEFNGESYFYSLQGMFASFNARIADFLNVGGDHSPFVTSRDIDGMYGNEIIAGFTSPNPYSGLGYFDGRTGQPAFGMIDPVVERMYKVYGTALADLDGDGLAEVITVGSPEQGRVTLFVKQFGVVDYPGFPIDLPFDAAWIGNYPIVADLDLDGHSEVILSFFTYDFGAIYILRSDGSTYGGAEIPGSFAFTAPKTFGTPTVANLTGDAYPEICFRGGHLLPGMGSEQVFLLDYRGELIEGWPITTPARWETVLSSRMAPLVDDLDNDGLVELILPSDGHDMLVWDFDAPVLSGVNVGRFLADNLNSGYYQSTRLSNDVETPETPLLPNDVTLGSNYPNPFNPTTTIPFALPSNANVRIELFNILGQSVAVLLDEFQEAGEHAVQFDGASLASGIYFYRLTSGETALIRKMVLVK
jgi:hypothetical protein